MASPTPLARNGTPKEKLCLAWNDAHAKTQPFASTLQALLEGARDISFGLIFGQLNPQSLDPGNQDPDDFRPIQSSSTGKFHLQAITDPKSLYSC